jgi:uncharacterized protein YdbL (DUF1318 family)
MLTRRFLLSLFLLLPLLCVTPAYAADALDTAKAAGQVGERPDGMLGIVGASTPALEALVQDINARRLEVFKGIAAKNGQSLAAVQAVSGEEFMSRTPAGQYIMSGSGAWVVK